MVDDTYYITPHETALAVVATSMKKARLRLDTLIINSTVGGLLFSAGGMLYLYSRAENPAMAETNPGIINFLGALTYGIGLFYVVINGADLFNSNILFFSVGFLRGAVTICDLLVSWSISWLFNLGGSLFMCYVICYLSGVATSENMVAGSIYVASSKASFSFIQTFIKGIAGNFCVCLAVYLQLMAKPIHVKYILITLPIFTFVAMGFTHVVADMYLVPMGMMNGAPVSVGEYIWKLLIPATLGNMVGGTFFGAVIPYYLHLFVVEQDRKKLELPEYDARDEQPELNMDSRVVRTDPKNIDEELDSEVEDFDQNEKTASRATDSFGSGETYTNDEENASMQPQRYFPKTHSSVFSSALNKTKSAGFKKRAMRSPAGVFPVQGMGDPLLREMSIADPSIVEKVKSKISAQETREEGNEKALESAEDSANHARLMNEEDIYDPRAAGAPTLENLDDYSIQSYYEPPLSTAQSSQPAQQASSHLTSSKLNKVPTFAALEKEEEQEYKQDGGYDVNANKLGTKLEKALSHIAGRDRSLSKSAKHLPVAHVLPLTNQDTENFTKKHPDPQITRAYSEVQKPHPALLKSLRKSFNMSSASISANELQRRLSEVGVTQRAARAADNIAGLENFQDMDLPVSTSPFYTLRKTSTSTSTSSRRADGDNDQNTYKNSKKPRAPSNLKNVVLYDNDDMEEQSIAD
ncbi:hypothetical protein ACO0QE_000121 [Hanseniaspora vineae]